MCKFEVFQDVLLICRVFSEHRGRRRAAKYLGTCHAMAVTSTVQTSPQNLTTRVTHTTTTHIHMCLLQKPKA